MPFNLIVFDLDFTLWNAGGTWCDHTYPPYRKVNDHIVDQKMNQILLYPDVKTILINLKNQGYTMGLASRTGEPAWALQLLELFNIEHFFTYNEIYPGSKTEHFRQIRKKSGYLFSEMIFFDDEQRNVEDVEMLGVKAVMVPNGISAQLINEHIG